MLLLSTSSLTGYGLHRVFSFAKQAGYTGIDLSLNFLNFDLWDEDYIYQLTQEFHLPVISITSPNKGMSSEKLDKIIRMAEKLSCQIITVSPPHITDKDTKWFGQHLMKLKQNLRISICVQNVEPKVIFFIISEYRNATLGQIREVTGDTTLDLIAVDSASNMDIMKAQELLGGSIKNVLFSDKKSLKRGILPGGAGGGMSHLPLESFLMKLKATGYGGYITLKVNPSEIGQGNEQRVMQNLEYMKSYYEKHFVNFKPN